jgi:hypothetical protein
MKSFETDSGEVWSVLRGLSSEKDNNLLDLTALGKIKRNLGFESTRNKFLEC